MLSQLMSILVIGCHLHPLMVLVQCVSPGWFHTQPEYKFGCRCYPCLRPYNSHKLNFRSQPCTFIGYSNHNKGYKCLSSDGHVFIFRNVLFDEMTFPFNTYFPCPSSASNSNTIQQSIPIASSSNHIISTCHESSTNSFHLPDTPTPALTSLALPRTITPTITSVFTESQEGRFYAANSTQSPMVSPRHTSSKNLPIDQSHSSDSSPTSLEVTVTDVSLNSGSNIQSTHNYDSMVTRSKNGIVKTKVFLVNYLESKPLNVKEALKHIH